MPKGWLFCCADCSPKEPFEEICLGSILGARRCDVCGKVLEYQADWHWVPKSMIKVPPYRRLMDLTLQLHLEIDKGEPDNQGDEIREEMDDLWQLVPPEAKKTINDMSGLLNIERRLRKEEG